jgi:putative FmdB family regulatory protein
VPTYQYKCKKCELLITENRSINSESSIGKCPADKCNGQVSQVYGTIGIGFKGQGFYSTDKKERNVRTEAS